MNNGAFIYSGAELDALAGAKNYCRWILSQFRPYIGKAHTPCPRGLRCVLRCNICR